MRRKEQRGTHVIFLRRLLTDEEYFQRIYDTYFHKVYNYIYTLVWDHSETERLVEKTFWTAMNCTDISTDDSTMDCWVYRIIRRVLEDEGVEVKKI